MATWKTSWSPIPVTVASKRLCAIVSKAVAAAEEGWQVDEFNEEDDDASSDEKRPRIGELREDIAGLERDVLKSDVEIARLQSKITVLDSGRSWIHNENAGLLSKAITLEAANKGHQHALLRLESGKGSSAVRAEAAPACLDQSRVGKRESPIGK